MALCNDITSALNRSISLHEQLREVIKDDCRNVDVQDNAPHDQVDVKAKIEREIELINGILSDLFSRYDLEFLAKPVESEREISMLVGELHRNIKVTLSVIENAYDVIKEARNVVHNEIKKLNNNKLAINAYSKY